jgi:FtsH-binding integral membrane protein
MFNHNKKKIAQKSMRPAYQLLYYGLLVAWLAGFVVSALQSFQSKDARLVMLPFLICAILLLPLRIVVDKIETNAKLANIEYVFLIGNIATIVFAFGLVIVSFSHIWLIPETKFIGSALGIPSLIATFYWRNARKR